MKIIIHSILASITCITFCAAQVVAEKYLSKVENALVMALEHKTIAAGADKMKLYGAHGTLSKDRISWSFSFYDGGDLVHSVSINSKGQLHYSSRDKGSSNIFKTVDFTKVVKPTETLIPDLKAKAMKALNALEFIPDDSGKMYISYSLRAHYKTKDIGDHYWKIAMPTGDGTSGKMVGFKNGNLDTISNSTVKNK